MKEAMNHIWNGRVSEAAVVLISHNVMVES